MLHFELKLRNSHHLTFVLICIKSIKLLLLVLYLCSIYRFNWFTKHNNPHFSFGFKYIYFLLKWKFLFLNFKCTYLDHLYYLRNVLWQFKLFFYRNENQPCLLTTHTDYNPIFYFIAKYSILLKFQGPYFTYTSQNYKRLNSENTKINKNTF